MAALGHHGGQEFGPPATLTFHTYSIFFVPSRPFIFLCCLQLCATLRLLCFPIAGRGWSSSGLGGGAGGESHWPRSENLSSALLCRSYYATRSTFFFSFLSFFAPILFFLAGTSPHFSPPLQLQSIFSPFLISSAAPGWETGHSCRGTASLSRVALSRALTKTYRHELPWQPPFLLTTLL